MYFCCKSVKKCADSQWSLWSVKGYDLEVILKAVFFSVYVTARVVVYGRDKWLHFSPTSALKSSPLHLPPCGFKKDVDKDKG